MVKVKQLWDQASSEIGGFLHGLRLDTGSIWCSNVIYARRRTARDYYEELDLAYCLSESDGVRAQPSLSKS